MDLNGTYLGLSPTDESGVGLGELKIVITDETIDYWFASGLEVHTDSAPRPALEEMTADELAAEFTSEADLTGITGFKVNGNEGPILLYWPDNPDEPMSAGVTILRFVSAEIDEIFGTTFLFTPAQVADGRFDDAVRTIESIQGDPGVIPRIANDGRRG